MAPAASALMVVGLTAYLHAPAGMLPACFTVTRIPAAAADPVRPTSPVFADISKTTRVVLPEGVIETIRSTAGFGVED